MGNADQLPALTADEVQEAIEYIKPPETKGGYGTEDLIRFAYRYRAVEVVERLSIELEQLRKIAAYVPAQVYIEAKEKAGFGDEITAHDGPR